MFHRIVMAALLTGLLAGGAHAQQPTSIGQQTTNPSGWTFNVAPYLWLPTINTTLNYNLPSPLGARLPTEVSVGPGEIVSRMNFAAAVAADAQYGPFSLLTDFMYLNLSATGSHFRSIDFLGEPAQQISRSVELSNGTSLNTTLWTLAGGYTLLQGAWGNLDVIAGFRYFRVHSTTDFDLAVTFTAPGGSGATFGGIGGVSSNSTIWNGIGGVRGRIRLGTTGLFIPYYFDIGGGGSSPTWQIASGLGYQTGWAGVSVTYRRLSFQEGGNAIVQHLTMGGPMIMVNFTF
jgi:hypothetical protein